MLPLLLLLVPLNTQAQPTKDGWGKTEDGLQSRLVIEGGNRRLKVNDKLNFEIILKNVSSEEKLLDLKTVSRWMITLGSQDAFVLQPVTDDSVITKLKPGEEKVFTRASFTIRAFDWAGPYTESDVRVLPGKYHLRVAMPFWQPDPNRPGVSTGLRTVPGEVDVEVAPYNNQPQVRPLPSTKSMNGIRWGGTTSGIQLGVSSIKDSGPGGVLDRTEFVIHLRNSTDRPLNIRYWRMPIWELAPIVKDAGGKSYMATSTFYSGILADQTAIIQPGQVVDLARATLAFANYTGGENVPTLKDCSPGKYTAVYYMNVCWADTNNTSLTMETGAVPFEIAATKL